MLALCMASVQQQACMLAQGLSRSTWESLVAALAIWLAITYAAAGSRANSWRLWHSDMSTCCWTCLDVMPSFANTLVSSRLAKPFEGPAACSRKQSRYRLRAWSDVQGSISLPNTSQKRSRPGCPALSDQGQHRQANDINHARLLQTGWHIVANCCPPPCSCNAQASAIAQPGERKCRLHACKHYSRATYLWQVHAYGTSKHPLQSSHHRLPAGSGDHTNISWQACQ